MASLDEQGTLLIYNVNTDGTSTTLTEYKKIDGFYVGARALEWMPDNKKICVVGSDKNLYGRAINIETETNMADFRSTDVNPNTVAVRTERPFTLAIGGESMNVNFYQGPPYKFLSASKNHIRSVNQVLYSPDSNLMVSVGSDRKIIIYDGRISTVKKELMNAHASAIMGVVWLDNETFVTCGYDKKIKKWNKNLELQAEMASVDNAEELTLMDSNVVAIAYCKEKIYYVLLSGEIKETNTLLSEITNRAIELNQLR